MLICLQFVSLPANTPAQAENLLHSLERADAGIGLHVNALETEYMCFNQTDDISTLNSSSLKLVDKFTYLGSSVSSTETDINRRLAKSWTTVDRLSVIWKSDMTDKKTQFLPSCSRVDTAIWMHYMDDNKANGEKAWQQRHKNAARNIEQIMEAVSHKAAIVQSPTTHHENYPS